MAKRTNEYPEWAERFRGKGRTIRKVKNGYALYECTSEYVGGGNYPKLKQKYLGMITEKDGFVPKKSDAPNPVYIEYGLSRFLRGNFRREAVRHTYDFNDDLFRLGIIQFIFGSTDEAFLESSALTYAESGRLAELAGRIRRSRVEKISAVIGAALEARIPDDADREVVRRLLMLCVTEAGPAGKRPHIPDRVTSILEANGLRYDAD